MSVLKLRKPIKIDGNEVTELTYDLEGLTGADLDDAVMALKRAKVPLATVELDPSYHAAVFAQAAGVDMADLRRLSARDYKEATVAVRNFFLSASAELSDQKQ